LQASLALLPLLLSASCAEDPAPGPATVEADDPLCEEACAHAVACDALDVVHARDLRTCVAACNGHPNASATCIRDAPCPHLPLCVSVFVGCFGACTRLEGCGALDEGGLDRCLWACERNEPDPLVLACIADAPSCADAVDCQGQPCEPGARDCLPHTCLDDAYEPNQTVAEATPLGPDGLDGLALCGDGDLFVFTLRPNQSARLTLRFFNDYGDIDAGLSEVQQEGLIQVDWSTSTRNTEVLVAPRVEVQTTFVVDVYAYNITAAEGGAYALDFELNPEGVLCRGYSCADDAFCNAAKVCQPNPPCTQDWDCGGGRCDLRDGRCYACLSDDDCAGFCSPERTCLECLSDTDCDDPEQRCQEGACFLRACDDAPGEPNDELADATPLTEGTHEGGALCNGDSDWYAVEVPNGATLYAEVNFEHEAGDLDVEAFLLVPSGNLHALGTSSSTTNDEHLLVTVEEGWTVFLILVGADQVAYTLTVDLDPDAVRCATDSDCPIGLTCNPVGLCRPPTACSTDAGCPDGRCSPDGRCLACLDDDDCRDTLCVADRCVRCASDADCPAWLACIDASCQPTTCLNEPLEPNDTRDAAAPLPDGYTADLAICTDDADWFQLDAEAGEALYILVKFRHARGDLDAVLRDPEGAVLSESRSITDNEYLYARALQSGPHALFVTSFGDGAAYGLELQRTPALPLCHDNADCDATERCDDTRLCIPQDHCAHNPDCRDDTPACDPDTHTCRPCQLDPSEPNDAIDHAATLPITPAEFNTCGGEDWFEVLAEPGQTLHVLAQFDHDDGDLDLSLFTPAGAHLASALSSDDDEHLTWPVTVSGRILLRVAGFDGAYNGYRLTVWSE